MNCKLKSRCIRKEDEYCYKCVHNDEVIIPKNYFKGYDPVCPIGYTNCIHDPAYIAYAYPSWYKELYNNLTPLQAARLSCHPSCDMCCDYDDEDK